MVLTNEDRNPARRSPGERGFSLLEGLIGAMLFLLVVIGVLPLFVRAMMDNTAGADYTRVSNYAKSGNEDFSRSFLDQNNYAVQPGNTQLVIDQYLDPATGLWKTWPPPAAAGAQWRRTTTVSNYEFADVLIGGTFDVPLDGGQPAQIQQAQVLVQNIVPTGPFGGRRQTLLRYLKAF